MNIFNHTIAAQACKITHKTKQKKKFRVLHKVWAAVVLRLLSYKN